VKTKTVLASKEVRRRSAQVTIFSAENQGGLHVSVGRFHEALSRFSTHTLININYRESLGAPAEDCLQVPIFENKIARAFGYITHSERLRIKAILQKCDFVLIHVPFRFHAHWVARECVKNNVPYIFVAHGAFDPYVFSYRKLRKRLWSVMLGRWMLKNAHCTIYSTLEEQRKAQVQMGPHRSQVFYWPVDLPRPYDKESARLRLAKSYGLSPQKRILLYLGRLHSMKRPRETIEAFLKLSSPDWVLLVAGPDEEYSKSELSILSERNNNVRLLGPVFGEAKEALLAGSDLTILLSRRENFGFAIVESLSYAVPAIVSSEVDIAGEIIQNNAGIVIDARNQENIETGLSAALQLPQVTLTSLGQNGRSWVETKLGIQEFQEKVRSTVEALWLKRESSS